MSGKGNGMRRSKREEIKGEGLEVGEGGWECGFKDHQTELL